ncbi:hypothetical protein, partial [Flavicella sp.]|uniref:hypothetical protein n=1 Tax=Flavicella sp. TaxID=2957742 RepID=UPI00260E62D9
KEQTIKIYLSDISLDQQLKTLLEKINGVRIVEVQESMSRNRVKENLTIFRDEDISINILKEKVDDFLESYFERVDI